MLETFYTLKEAADALKISTKMLNELLHQGVINAVRIGTRWRIPESALNLLAAIDTLPRQYKSKQRQQDQGLYGNSSAGFMAEGGNLFPAPEETMKKVSGRGLQKRRMLSMDELKEQYPDNGTEAKIVNLSMTSLIPKEKENEKDGK